MRTTQALNTHALPRNFALLFCGLAATLSVSAANLTWTAAVNGTWDGTTLNWFNGSTSTAFHTGDNVTFDDTAATSSVFLSSAMAPGSVVVNTGVIYSFTGGAITGNGGLTKFGTGKVNLANSNLYTGNTIINGGTVALVSNGSISNSATIGVASGTTLDASGRFDGTLTLASGQTLTGSGTVRGTVTTLSGSVIAPGAGGIGTLTVNSNLNLAGNVVVELSGTTLLNDLITGINQVNYGGTLTVSNLGGALAAGESFTLFGFSSFAGNFTSIVGSPGSGLVYSFNPATGVLSVNSTPPATSANFWVNTVQSNLLCVRFDQMVSVAAAGDPANYTLYTKGNSSGAVSITNAIVQGDRQSVALYLDNSAGEFFAVSANNIVTNSSGSNLTVNATGYTGNFTSVAIGTSTDPSPAGQVLSIFGDTFNVTGGGSDIGGTDDHCQFVYQQVTNDFDFAAEVTAIQATDPGSKAGLMARESLNAGSRSIGTYLTALALGTHTNQLQAIQRTTTNGASFLFGAPLALNSLAWLRMTRTNGIFTTYYGSNGLNWTQSGSTLQAFSGTLYVGLAGTSHTNGDTSTAAFTGFGVGGARPGDGVKPSVSVYFYNKTNLIVKWQRTPRDFTVQVGQSLTYTNLGTGTNTTTESNVTQWAFLMLPVYDTALTGTNPVVPTPGRYMNIPTYLFTNSALYIRLAQVDRLIPDPPGVTPGVIFCQANGSLKSGPPSLSTLCGTPVVFSNSVASTNVPILCPSSPANKYSYQFTTTPSGSTYNTILSVRHFPAIGASNCDTAFSAGNGKAQLTLTPSNNNSGYTFVAAPTTPITLDCPIKVQVNVITNF